MKKFLRVFKVMVASFILFAAVQSCSVYSDESSYNMDSDENAYVLREAVSEPAVIDSVSSLYASDLSHGIFKSDFIKGKYKIHASAEKPVVVQNVSTVTINSRQISHALSLSGGGSARNFRCVSFSTSDSASITVYASGNSDRKIILSDGIGNILDSFVLSDKISSYVFNVKSKGTYCLYSSKYDARIYYIKTAVGKNNESGVNENPLGKMLYPLPESENVFEDVELRINFSSHAEIVPGKSARIYDYSGKLVDTIKTSDEILNCGKLTSSISRIAVGSQLVRAEGNSIFIRPHSSSDGSASVLENGKKYYVQLDDGFCIINGKSFSVSDRSWCFTVRSRKEVKNNFIRVGKSSGCDFSSLQGAFNYLMGSGASGKWKIFVEGGTYNEYLHFNKENKPDVLIYADEKNPARFVWKNFQNFKSAGISNGEGGARTRSTFFWNGGDLSLKNLEFVNTQEVNISGDLQAETLVFDAQAKRLACYRTKFSSFQDTLYLNTMTRSWFYDCEVTGDVDAIWGYPEVALFEKCVFNIFSNRNSAKKTAYLFESRIGYRNTSGIFGKGFTALDCTFNVQDSSKSFYFGRRAGSSKDYYDQIAIINPSVKGNVRKETFCEGSNRFRFISGKSGNVLIGCKTYGLPNASSNPAKGIGIISKSEYLNEYSSRDKILNRGIDIGAKNYVQLPSFWDVSSVMNDFGISLPGSSSSASSGNYQGGGEKIITGGFATLSRPSRTVTVSRKEDLVNYAKKGGYVIYVEGMIDMSDGYLPSGPGLSNSKLDALVSSNTGYASYESFRNAYASSCTLSTNDKSSSLSESSLGKYLWKCNSEYGKIIKFSVASDTHIIGKGPSSGIKGGSMSITSVSNVLIQNLVIQDAYDPFPHHEKNDGYNAQWDCIVIQQNSKNIWVDHCTFKDTMGLSYVMTSGRNKEKWQTYDGLLDMKGSISDITVSYCKFSDHDKTMLIGSSDSDGSNLTRTVTLHHNYFSDCGQRLPMARNVKLHAYNNVFESSNKKYKQQYAIGCRANSLIVAENNYFGKGIAYSFKENGGNCFSSGNVDESKEKSSTNFAGTAPFPVTYNYTPENANSIAKTVPVRAGNIF